MSRRGIRPSRAGASVDILQVIEAVRGPGIDTRTWIANGYLSGPATYDAVSGLWFAPVVFTPSQIGPVNCRIEGWAAGPGVAVYAPLRAGDEVSVAIPEGNPNAGPKIIGRSYTPTGSPSGPPPLAAGYDNNSIVIVTQAGSGIQIRVEADKVTLGKHIAIEADPKDAAVLGTTYTAAENAWFTALQTALDSFAVFAQACSGTTTDPVLKAAAAALVVALGPPPPASTIDLALQQFNKVTTLSKSVLVGT